MHWIRSYRIHCVSFDPSSLQVQGSFADLPETMLIGLLFCADQSRALLLLNISLPCDVS